MTTTTRRCKGCGSEFTLDPANPNHAWWLINMPDFCSEDCEYYHYHPEEN
jgi:hypothetical protein